MRPIDRCIDCISGELAELLGEDAVNVFGGCKAATSLAVKDCQDLANHKRAGRRLHTCFWCNGRQAVNEAEISPCQVQKEEVIRETKRSLEELLGNV